MVENAKKWELGERCWVNCGGKLWNMAEKWGKYWTRMIYSAPAIDGGGEQPAVVWSGGAEGDWMLWKTQKSLTTFCHVFQLSRTLEKVLPPYAKFSFSLHSTTFMTFQKFTSLFHLFLPQSFISQNFPQLSTTFRFILNPSAIFKHIPVLSTIFHHSPQYFTTFHQFVPLSITFRDISSL